MVSCHAAVCCIPNFATDKSPPQHNRASSMLFGWCDTGGCSTFTNSSPHIDPPIWPTDFELWFISPKNFIPLLYCQSLCTLAHWSLLTLFCFFNHGFLTAILPFRSALQSLLLRVNVDTFFHNIGSVFCQASWWLCISKTSSILQGVIQHNIIQCEFKW